MVRSLQSQRISSKLSSYVLSNSEGQSYTLPADMPFDLLLKQRASLLWLDGEPSEGGHHMGFTPSSQSDITLTGPDGIVAAELRILQVGVDTSWGRQVDGSHHLHGLISLHRE